MNVQQVVYKSLPKHLDTVLGFRYNQAIRNGIAPTASTCEDSGSVLYQEAEQWF